MPRPTYTVLEGWDLEITVNLDKETDRNVKIPIMVTMGDFELPETVLDFTVGQDTQSFTITADQQQDDDVVDTTFELGFGELPQDVSAAEMNATTMVTFTDDDRAALVASFAEAEYSATEGWDVTVMVTLDQMADREVTIPITTDPAEGRL